MSITYEEALETLNSMFTDPWTTESLDAVLRLFEGHMENTIEAILAHGDGNPDELIKRLSSGEGVSTGSSSDAGGGGGGADSSISVDEEIARQLAKEEEKRSKSRPGINSNGGPSSSGGSRRGASRKTGKKKGRGTPTTLPPDFLRIPGHKYPAASDDEQLARMLQDEMLQQELANNKEFAHLARARGGYPRGGFGGRQRGAASYAQGGAGGGGNQMEGPNIMDKLSEMGEQAKRRLALMAAQFNAQRQQAGMNPSQQNAAVQERRGLLDDNAGNEEEVSFLGSPQRAANGRDVEMREMSSPGSKKKD